MEGYKLGDKCIKCGRPVIKENCVVCNGSGKAPKSWGNTSCPLCGGSGDSIHCPVIVSLGDYFKGINCSHYDYEEVIINNKPDAIITRKKEFAYL
jgi:hypothetical protein